MLNGVFFFKYMLLHIRQIGKSKKKKKKKPNKQKTKNQKKKIPCRINKVTTRVYVTPSPILFNNISGYNLVK